MMDIDRISLSGVLPRVFAGMDNSAQVSRSQVWLHDVDLLRGRNYLVSAESGAGKSSLVGFLFGNRCDYEGRICFDGTDVRIFSPGRWCAVRCQALALLPQDMRLFPELTVRENIDVKNRLTGHKSWPEILRMLEMLDVDGKIDVRAGLLSVGQQQRVALVRALCQPFSFLLLDEPVSHLDAGNNAAAARLISEQAGACGAGVIVTSVGNHLALESYTELRL